MADNGHCSTCQTHDTKKGCGGKVESFKKLFGTQVQQNEDYLKLNNIMPNVEKNENINEEVFDIFKTILQAIKDYGQIDENNPTQDKIDALGVDKDNIIYLTDYNKILTALDQSNLSGSYIITKELIDSLQTYIQNYNINDTRCNICNTKCQNCQSDCDSNCNCQCQCTKNCDCSYECYGGGGTYYYGGQQCGASYYYSALEYKENIQDFTKNATELINNIHIVQFNYKNDNSYNNKIGFIANYTNELFSTKNHNIMDVYNCIGLLLKSIQELSKEINLLKQEIEKNNNA